MENLTSGWFQTQDIIIISACLFHLTVHAQSGVHRQPPDRGKEALNALGRLSGVPPAQCRTWMMTSELSDRDTSERYATQRIS